MFGNLQNGNITNSIANHVGAWIVVQQRYLPGDTLPSEGEIAKDLQVSRTAVREAMKMLAAKGLVLSWPRKGTIVQPESSWNLFDGDVLNWIGQRGVSIELVLNFLHLRLGIEPMAAQTAAKKGADISEIESALKEIQHAAEAGDSTLDADSNFHAAVLKASGNPFFENMAVMVNTALKLTIQITNRIKGVRLASIPEHKAIMDAIQAADPDTAYRLTHQHIKNTITLVEANTNLLKTP